MYLSVQIIANYMEIGKLVRMKQEMLGQYICDINPIYFLYFLSSRKVVIAVIAITAIGIRYN